MNKNTSAQNIKLSLAGVKPSAIAEMIGVSVNTVKSHLRRHKEEGAGCIPCLYCGTPVPQNEGRKQKKYCSDSCRMRYWNGQYRERKKHDGEG